VAFHEYLHQFLENSFPGVPPWLNEGMACFFQTMKLEGPVIRLGKAPDGFLPYLADHGLMPVERMLAVTFRSPDYTDPGERPWFYASAWLLTDYFMTGDEARRAQLTTYLEQIRLGRSLSTCYREAFGRSPADLDKELNGYLAQVKARGALLNWVIRFAALKPDPAFSFAPLTRPAALAKLGLLLLSGQKEDDARAREHFDAALALDPDCPSANGGLGMMAWRANRPEEAGPYFAKASLGDPDNATLHYYAGLGLLQGVYAHPEAPQNAAGRNQARKHLLRAVELGCPIPDALAQLAAVVLLEEHPSGEDLALLEEACQHLPGNYDLKLKLATLYDRAGQRERAGACLREVAGQTVDPQLAARASAQLTAEDAQEADHLAQVAKEAFKAKRYDEALAAQEAAVRRAPPRLKPGLQEDLANMRILIELRTKGQGAAARKDK
jgi:tetratricopeptide (TPR) repeat protein